MAWSMALSKAWSMAWSMAWSIFIFLAVLTGAQDFASDGCASNEFSCGDGSCIFKNLWCDGHYNCKNRYDESYCKMRRDGTRHIVCPAGMMTCELYSGDGCLPNKGICDNYRSCRDGLDERNCPSHQPEPPRVPATRRPATVDIPADVEDFDHDYEEDKNDYSDEEKNALNWVLKQRKDYAWGEETERAIVALSFSKHDKFGSDSEKDVMLMMKTLHLRISLDLSRNWHKFSMSHRALLVYALTATCGQPEDFYGYNLVADLRGSVNTHHSRRRVSAAPIVYLTLCLTNTSTPNDIEVMMIEATSLTANSKNDLKALYLLTTVCMEERETDEKASKMLERIKRYLVKNLAESEAENIYELALVTQALNAARVNPYTWGRDEKMNSILKHQKEDGSFRDMLATYYVMPLLSGKSLLSVGDHCGHVTQKDSVSMESLRNAKERMSVNYTLNFRPQNVSQTMFLSVSNNCTVYDVMRLAAKRNANFRFSLDDKKNSNPLVYSIGGIPNDAERGLFWILQVFRWYHPYEVTNIKTHKLQPGDDIIFSIKNFQY